MLLFFLSSPWGSVCYCCCCCFFFSTRNTRTCHCHGKYPFTDLQFFLVVKNPYDLRSQIRFWILPKRRTPKQKTSKVRQLMRWVYKTSVSHFKVKNTPLKDTGGKGKFKRMLSFLLMDKGKDFLYKIVLREVRNSRNFHHGRSERLACFESQPGSEVFEEFSDTFCTL